MCVHSTVKGSAVKALLERFLNSALDSRFKIPRKAFESNVPVEYRPQEEEEKKEKGTRRSGKAFVKSRCPRLARKGENAKGERGRDTGQKNAPSLKPGNQGS